MATGFSRRTYSSESPHTFSYEDVLRRYGIRVVLDRQASLGVSVISTREPVFMWRDELRSFAQPLSSKRLNRHLEGVRPRAVASEDGRPAPSWYCPSLLKALYLMLYLDVTTGTKMQKCEAPGCYNYYRVGAHERDSKYCPPPPDKKQSKCASRASSARYRERQRRKSDITQHKVNTL